VLSRQQLASLAFVDFYFRRGCAHCVLVARGFAISVAIGLDALSAWLRIVQNVAATRNALIGQIL
jgi:hypothetical protein